MKSPPPAPPHPAPYRGSQTSRAASWVHSIRGSGAGRGGRGLSSRCGAVRGCRWRASATANYPLSDRAARNAAQRGAARINNNESMETVACRCLPLPRRGGDRLLGCAGRGVICAEEEETERTAVRRCAARRGGTKGGYHLYCGLASRGARGTVLSEKRPPMASRGRPGHRSTAGDKGRQRAVARIDIQCGAAIAAMRAGRGGVASGVARGARGLAVRALRQPGLRGDRGPLLRKRGQLVRGR